MTKKLDDRNLKGSVEITVFWRNKILAVTSRRFGGFCGVGGKVEEGESFEEAARRELLEETGCKALSMHFIAGNTLDPIRGDDETVKWYCAGFIADIGNQIPYQTEEGTQVFWTTKENMIQNSLFPEWYKWWFGLLDELGIGLEYPYECIKCNASLHVLDKPEDHQEWCWYRNNWEEYQTGKI